MKFRLQKKLVVKVRYYEHIFYITDDQGEQLFVGTDEKRAQEILVLLNAYHTKKSRKRKR